MKNLSVLLLFLLLGTAVNAQNFTISGTIKDNSNGEQLIGVVIQIAENKTIGTTTNEYGLSLIHI